MIKIRSYGRRLGRTLISASLLLLRPSVPAFAECKLSKVIELPVTIAGLKPLVAAKINGVAVRLIVDTGATIGALSPEVMQQLGIATHPLNTAAPVRSVAGEVVRFEIGDIRDLEISGATFHDVDVLAGRIPKVASGRLGENLLGRTDAEYDLAHGVVRLFRFQRCQGASLAYWASNQPVSVLPLDPAPATRLIMGTVEINGRSVHAEFDTGAPETYLTRAAANRLGLNVISEAKAGAIRGMTGAGAPLQVSKAKVQSIKIGREEAHDLNLRVADFYVADTDILIGLDFFLAHRIVVDREHNRLIFTSNHGALFEPVAAPGVASQAGQTAPSAR